jgi:ATP-dependent Clp protease ATP-binding subunit ClpA
VINACKVDLGALKEQLSSYLDNELKKLVIDSGEPRLTAGFQRVVQRAVLYAQGRGRPAVTGQSSLQGIFTETQSPAVRLLGEQDMTRQDAVNFVIHRIANRKGRRRHRSLAV